MPGRKCLVHTLWLLSALVLLAWIPVAPTRKSGVVAVSSRSDCPRGNFARLQAELTARRAVMAPDADLAGDALACEDEEQDRVEVLNELRAPFFITCSFRMLPAYQMTSPCSIVSHYPIRC